MQVGDTSNEPLTDSNSKGAPKKLLILAVVVATILVIAFLKIQHLKNEQVKIECEKAEKILEGHGMAADMEARKSWVKVGDIIGRSKKYEDSYSFGLKVCVKVLRDIEGKSELPTDF